MRATVAAVGFGVLCAWASLAAAQPTMAGGSVPTALRAPRVLNLVMTKVKRGQSSAYAQQEAEIARAYERAKARVYWVCFQSPRDATDVLYLNLHESTEAADRMAAAYQDLVKRHPELVKLTDRLKDLTASTASTLTSRRDDVDRPSKNVDFGNGRVLRLTIFKVKQGREGDFLKAIRTTNERDGSWYVYEANDASTYALITLKREPFSRRDGPAVPRALRRAQGVYTIVDSKVYTIRPAMSHPPRTS